MLDVSNQTSRCCISSFSIEISTDLSEHHIRFRRAKDENVPENDSRMLESYWNRIELLVGLHLRC